MKRIDTPAPARSLQNGGPAGLLGITERLEFVDAHTHVEDLKR